MSADGAPPTGAANVETAGVVSDVYAVRTFHLSLDMHLLPVTDTTTDWVGGDCIAQCRMGGRHGPAPADHCECGIYAVEDIPALDQQNLPAARGLVAVLRLEGPIIESGLEYLAAAARVVALWIAPRLISDRERRQLQANLPGVLFFEGLSEMATQSPGSDLLGEASRAPGQPTDKRTRRWMAWTGGALALVLRRVAPAFTMLFFCRQLTELPGWLPGSDLRAQEWTLLDAVYALPKVVTGFAQALTTVPGFLTAMIATIIFDVFTALLVCDFYLRALRFRFTISRRLVALGMAAALVPDAAGSRVVLALCLGLGICSLLPWNLPFVTRRDQVISDVDLMDSPADAQALAADHLVSPATPRESVRPDSSGEMGNEW